MEASHSLTEVNCVKSTASGASGLVPLSKIPVLILTFRPISLPFLLFFFFLNIYYLCRGIEGGTLCEIKDLEYLGLDPLQVVDLSKNLRTRVEK